MKKTELIQLMAEDAGISMGAARIAMQSILEGISNSLATDERKVTLRGFGTFSKIQRKARKVRNPRTGEPIHIKARNVVLFRASKKLKASI